MESGTSGVVPGLTAEQLSAALHDLAQPMTVLLCTLECAMELTSVDEIRLAIRSALRECERMKTMMLLIQATKPPSDRPM